MAQVNELLTVRASKETTWGTPVTPSTVILGGVTDFSMNPDIEVADFPTLEGVAPIYQSAVVREGASASIQGVVTYQDLPYYLDALLGEAAPAGVPTLTPTSYTRSYAGPTTQLVQSPRIMTLRYGTTAAGYAIAGGIIDTLEISGNAGEAGQFSAGFLGKEIVSTVAAGTLSARNLDIAKAAEASLFIDAWGGTIGTTQITGAAYSFNLSLQANRALLMGLGSINPHTHIHSRFGATLSLNLEFPGADAVAQGILNDIITATQVQRLIRIRFEKSATEYINLDFAGIATGSPDLFGDQDGASTLELEFTGKLNSTAGFWFQSEVSNLVATLP